MRSRRGGGADAAALAPSTTATATHAPSGGTSPTMTFTTPSGLSGGGGGALDISEMDPWKDDRCRDFIVLNTIQRLRAYHLPRDAPMPEVEPVNAIRSKNLVMLPRAQPDYRPCQGERRPSRAELRARRRRERKVRRAENHLSGTSSASSDDSDEASDETEENEEEDEETREVHLSEEANMMRTPDRTTPSSALHGHALATTEVCAVDRARALYFGVQSFTSSTSPRHLVNTPHVALTPSPLSTSNRKVSTRERESRGGAAKEAGEDVSFAVISRSLQDDLDTLFSGKDKEEEGKDGRGGEQTATAVKPENGVTGEIQDQDKELTTKTDADVKTEPSSRSENGEGFATGAPVATDGDAIGAAPAQGAADASPAPKDPQTHPEDTASAPVANEASDSHTLLRTEISSNEPAEPSAPVFSCDVTSALLAHYQSLLTRGVVLDKLNHKEMGFAWWVVGRDMSVAALDEVARPPRREALLITLRNFYYGMLTDNKRRVSGTHKAAEEEDPHGAAPGTATESKGTADGVGVAGEGNEEGPPSEEGVAASPELGTGGRSRRTAALRAKAVLAATSSASSAAAGPPAPAGAAVATGVKRKRAAPKSAKGTSSPEKQDAAVAAPAEDEEGTKGNENVDPEGEGGARKKAKEETKREDETHSPAAPTQGQDAKRKPRVKGSKSTTEPVTKKAKAENVHREESPEPRATEDASGDEDTDEEDVDEHEEKEEAHDSSATRGILPGRGRTHGEQGRAAARRSALEVTWRPLRASQRRGASVTAPPSEESSLLQAPTAAAVTQEPTTMGTKPTAKKTKPQGKKSSVAASTTASREASLPQPSAPAHASKAVAEVVAAAGGKKRARGATSTTGSEAAKIEEAPAAPKASPPAGKAVPHPKPGATGASQKNITDTGKDITKSAEKTEAKTETVVPSSSAEGADAPLSEPQASPPPAPSEAERAAAARLAYLRATESCGLVPTPADHLLEVRIRRRMAGSLAPPSSATGDHDVDPAEHAKTLSTQSSYAFLLSSPSHLPPKPTHSKKRRATTAAAATASPWEAVATTATTALTEASADGAEDSAVRESEHAKATASEGSPDDMEAEVHGNGTGDRAERRGRKRKPLTQTHWLDADGAVDPVLTAHVVRHDQAHLESLIQQRLAREAQGAPRLIKEEEASVSTTDVPGAQKHEASAQEPSIVKREMLETSADVMNVGSQAYALESSSELQVRRDALIKTPFSSLPYALRCLVTWEASELLLQHRERLARRTRRRRQTAGLQRQKGPMTRRMAALAARGELPSTSSGSSSAVSENSDWDDTTSEEEEEEEEEDDIEDSSGEDEEDGDRGKAQTERRAEGDRGCASSFTSLPTHLDGQHARLPRKYVDYWAEYRCI